MITKNYGRIIKGIGICLIMSAVLFPGKSYCLEKKAKVMVEEAKIFLHPDASSQVIGIAKKDTLLSLQSVSAIKRIWYYIYFSTGEEKIPRSGYILVSDVRVVEVTPEMAENVLPVEIVKPVSVKPETKKTETTTDKPPKPFTPKVKKLKKRKDPRLKTEKPKNSYFSFGMSYFFPTEERFRTVYGNGLVIDGELTFAVLKDVKVWVGASYLSKKGELTFTREETKLKIMPLKGGLKYRILKGKFNIYLGIGVGYHQLKETNPIGEVSKGGLGYLAKMGGFFNLAGGGLFEIFTEYSYCRIKPTDFYVNIGGLKAGLAFGWQF